MKKTLKEQETCAIIRRGRIISPGFGGKNWRGGNHRVFWGEHLHTGSDLLGIILLSNVKLNA